MAAGFEWEVEGRRVGDSLDRYHAILVLGTDDAATAQVAIGIGRAQAPRRRVAIGDLLGESPPLQALVEGDDPHGISDSFTYGVSLNRIAREVPAVPGLYVMPSGTEPVDPAEVFPNQRWRRLAGGFREVGALLVLAARADAPAVEELAVQLDGVVLVGDVVPTRLPVATVIAAVRRPMLPALDEAHRVSMPVGISAIEPEPRRIAPATWLKGAAAVLLISALGVWFAARPFASDVRPYGPKPDSTRPVSAVVPGVADTGAAGDSAGLPSVTNPADSAAAAAWAVEMFSTNTFAGAAARVREESDRSPASTFTPALVEGAVWYKVVAGAYAGRETADSLAAALRQRGRLDERSTVVRLPYAWLVNSAVASERVRGLLGAYRDLGQPVYALQQPDGTFNVYAGAFESPTQAAMLLESLRAAGISTPSLVFRTGRVF